MMWTPINRTLLALLMAGGLIAATGCQETEPYEAQKPALEEDAQNDMPAPTRQDALDQQPMNQGTPGQGMDQPSTDQPGAAEQGMDNQGMGDDAMSGQNAADDLGETPAGGAADSDAAPAGAEATTDDASTAAGDPADEQY